MRKTLILFIFLATFALVSCKSQDPVVLNIGTFAGSAWNVPNPETYFILDEAISRFEKQYPQIQVVYKSGILRSDYSEWLSQKVLTGSEPDCFFILPEDFPLFADMGILEPLGDFLEKSKRLTDMQFFDSTLQASTFNGILYALPEECDSSLMFVNTTLLDELGLSFPAANWTWDDLLSLCKQATKDSNNDGHLDTFGISGFSWSEAVYTNGQNLFNDSGTRALLDSEEVYESFKFLFQLQNLTKDERIPDFWDGNVLFSIAKYSWYRAYGYYPYSILKSGKFKWKATVLPRGPEGSNAAELDTLALGISQRSKHKQEAKLFIEFLLTDETLQGMHLQRSRGLSASQKNLDSESIQAILLNDITLEGDEISTQTLARAINESVVYPSFRKYQGAVRLINTYFPDIVGTEDKLRNSLYHLNNELNAYLEE
ncbi:sugar ABC transporter substrate-binding protein [uncultured Sphaerochaeta sp.]|uniref:ABC transporter substrate-binding protein n=1 Tax=uncultured Sphaerochaeta sp. TaxID=886478 RepID=UPI002A0A5477|nr:sugar ABC transporter substrate-binding protein [uncultured Sphaerochaeta sp.]